MIAFLKSNGSDGSILEIPIEVPKSEHLTLFSSTSCSTIRLKASLKLSKLDTVSSALSELGNAGKVAQMI